MKLKKWSLLLGVTIQDVLNVANAQDPWIGHLAMLDRMKKTSIVPNAMKTSSLPSVSNVTRYVKLAEKQPGKESNRHSKAPSSYLEGPGSIPA